MKYKYGDYLVKLLVVLVVIIIIKLLKLDVAVVAFFSIVFPFTIAFLIAWSLEPFVKALENRKVKRKLAVMIVLTVIVLAILGFILLVVPVFVVQVQELVKYAPNINSTINDVIEKSNEYFNIDLSNLHLEQFTSWDYYLNQDFIQKAFSGGLSILTTAFGVISGILFFIVSAFIVVCASIYMMIDFDKTILRIYAVLPKRMHSDTDVIVNGFYRIIVEFFRSSIVITIILFILTWITFSIIGLEGAVVLALIVAITNLIPYIGPYVGSVPALIVALTIDFKTMVIVLIAILILQQLESSFIRPKLMGSSLEIHPAIGLMSVVLFGALFGIIGMIFAMPIMGMVILIIKLFYGKLVKKYPDVLL